MKLSIVVTCYNVEKYIEDCLKSIIPQLNSETELIVIDDCSTDETINCILKFDGVSKQSITVIRNRENLGVSASRNKGLELATGDYVAFIDGDDYVSGEYVKTILKYLQTNKDYYLLSWASLGDVYKKYDSRKLPRWNYAVWCRIFKRELIKHNFDETMSWAEDAKFLDENITKEMTFDCIPNTLYYYRHMRKGSITQIKLG